MISPSSLWGGTRARRRSIVVPLLCLPCLALLLPPCSVKALTIEDNALVFRGQPVFVRGAMYYQPAAYHQYFWEEWNRDQFLRDLDDVTRHGFNALALQINWGSFASSVDPDTGVSHWNESAFGDLQFALANLSERGIIAILWTGTARIPEGVEGNHSPAWTDLGGNLHPPYSGYLIRDWPALAANDTPLWRAMLEFHSRLAQACADFDNLIYDPLDWQHLNINTWSFADPGNLAAWREWLRSRNPDLDYWNQRWCEANHSWDEVLLPVNEWVEMTVALLGPPYQGRPRDPHEGSKWADFRDWHDALCNSVNAQIVASLRAADSDALIGQRIDPWRFGDFRQRTWAPEGVNLIFHGTYPESVEQLTPDLVRREVAMVRERTPRPLPILFWETGLNPPIIPREEWPARLEPLQARWFDAVQVAAREENLLGFCWWVWRDYYMSEEAMHFGLLDLSGRPRLALQR